MTRRRWPLIVTLAALGCPGPAAVPDAGDDASTTDASVHDAGIHEVGMPTDAWADPRPFEPFVLEVHPEVTCEPVDFTYVAPDRPAVEAGTERWRYAPDADVAFRDAITDHGARPLLPFAAEENGLTGTLEGGVSMRVSGRGEMGVGSDGVFAYYNPAGTTYGHAYGRLGSSGRSLSRDPGFLARRDPAALSGDGGYIYGITDPDGTHAVPEWDAGRVYASAPVVLPAEGTVVWYWGRDLILSNCIVGGALRWAVQYDPPSRQTRLVHLSGERDGSIIAQPRDGHVFRLDRDGQIATSRFEAARSVAGVHETCGVLVSHGEDYEWWSSDTFETSSAFEGIHAALPPVRDGYGLGLTSVTSDCHVVGLRTGDAVVDGARVVDLVSRGPSESWAIRMDDSFEPSYAAPLVLADGGFLTSGQASEGPALRTYELDGSVRWTEVYGGPSQSFVIGADVLMPDGTYYAALRRRGVPEQMILVAIAVNATPSPETGSRRLGGWARTASILP